MQMAPTIQLDPDSPGLVTRGASYKIKGLVTDDQSVRHFFIFVGDEKVFYQSPETLKDTPGARTLRFEANLPHKKGANVVTISAQDDREMTTRKRWIVWREK